MAEGLEYHPTIQVSSLSIQKEKTSSPAQICFIDLRNENRDAKANAEHLGFRLEMKTS